MSCSTCSSRLIICHAESAQGNVYLYFVCGGDHPKRAECTRSVLLMVITELYHCLVRDGLDAGPTTIAWLLHQAEIPLDTWHTDGRASGR